MTRRAGRCLFSFALFWLSISISGIFSEGPTIDPCQRQPFVSSCTNPDGTTTRSQFVLRYYRRGTECVSYPYGHCRLIPEVPEFYKYKDECEKNCLGMPLSVNAGPVENNNETSLVTTDPLGNGVSIGRRDVSTDLPAVTMPSSEELELQKQSDVISSSQAPTARITSSPNVGSMKNGASLSTLPSANAEDLDQAEIRSPQGTLPQQDFDESGTGGIASLNGPTETPRVVPVQPKASIVFPIDRHAATPASAKSDIITSATATSAANTDPFINYSTHGSDANVGQNVELELIEATEGSNGTATVTFSSTKLVNSGITRNFGASVPDTLVGQAEGPAPVTSDTTTSDHIVISVPSTTTASSPSSPTTTTTSSIQPSQTISSKAIFENLTQPVSIPTTATTGTIITSSSSSQSAGFSPTTVPSNVPTTTSTIASRDVSKISASDTTSATNHTPSSTLSKLTEKSSDGTTRLGFLDILPTSPSKCIQQRLATLERQQTNGVADNPSKSLSVAIDPGFLPKCTLNGSFEAIQCDSGGKFCWCVDSEEGVELSATRIPANQGQPLCKGSTGTTSAQSVSSAPQCDAQPDAGPCKLTVPLIRWYYDATHRACETFHYGGCGGNGNNYDSKKECESRCIFQDAPQCSKGAKPLNDKEGELFNCINRTCPQGWKCTFAKSNAICCPVEESDNKKADALIEACRLPKDRGTCEKYELRFYYNSQVKECKYFFYGGCAGNANNFKELAECERVCGKGPENSNTELKPNLADNAGTDANPASAQFPDFALLPTKPPTTPAVTPGEVSTAPSNGNAPVRLQFPDFGLLPTKLHNDTSTSPNPVNLATLPAHLQFPNFGPLSKSTETSTIYSTSSSLSISASTTSTVSSSTGAVSASAPSTNAAAAPSTKAPTANLQFPDFGQLPVKPHSGFVRVIDIVSSLSPPQPDPSWSTVLFNQPTVAPVGVQFPDFGPVTITTSTTTKSTITPNWSSTTQIFTRQSNNQFPDFGPVKGTAPGISPPAPSASGDLSLQILNFGQPSVPSSILPEFRPPNFQTPTTKNEKQISQPPINVQAITAAGPAITEASITSSPRTISGLGVTAASNVSKPFGLALPVATAETAGPPKRVPLTALLASSTSKNLTLGLVLNSSTTTGSSASVVTRQPTLADWPGSPRPPAAPRPPGAGSRSEPATSQSTAVPAHASSTEDFQPQPVQKQIEQENSGIALNAPFIPGDRCNHPQDVGPCTGRFIRWFWDVTKNECDVFTYGGCQGNGNNFGSREECSNACRELPRNICLHPAQDGGECPGKFQRFSYDSVDNLCKPFIYGGCGGNGNNFGSISDCEAKCKNNNVENAPVNSDSQSVRPNAASRQSAAPEINGTLSGTSSDSPARQSAPEIQSTGISTNSSFTESALPRPIVDIPAAPPAAGLLPIQFPDEQPQSGVQNGGGNGVPSGPVPQLPSATFVPVSPPLTEGGLVPFSGERSTVLQQPDLAAAPPGLQQPLPIPGLPDQNVDYPDTGGSPPSIQPPASWKSTLHLQEIPQQPQDAAAVLPPASGSPKDAAAAATAQNLSPGNPEKEAQITSSEIGQQTSGTSTNAYAVAPWGPLLPNAPAPAAQAPAVSAPAGIGLPNTQPSSIAATLSPPAALSPGSFSVLVDGFAPANNQAPSGSAPSAPKSPAPAPASSPLALPAASAIAPNIALSNIPLPAVASAPAPAIANAFPESALSPAVQAPSISPDPSAAGWLALSAPGAAVHVPLNTQVTSNITVAASTSSNYPASQVILAPSQDIKGGPIAPEISQYPQQIAIQGSSAELSTPAPSTQTPGSQPPAAPIPAATSSSAVAIASPQPNTSARPSATNPAGSASASTSAEAPSAALPNAPPSGSGAAAQAPPVAASNSEILPSAAPASVGTPPVTNPAPQLPAAGSPSQVNVATSSQSAYPAPSSANVQPAVPASVSTVESPAAAQLTAGSPSGSSYPLDKTALAANSGGPGASGGSLLPAPALAAATSPVAQPAVTNVPAAVTIVAAAYQPDGSNTAGPAPPSVNLPVAGAAAPAPAATPAASSAGVSQSAAEKPAAVPATPIGSISTDPSAQTSLPDKCTQPVDPGPCKGPMKERYWFNAAAGKCEEFMYGGCAGNRNHFYSLNECEIHCGKGSKPSASANNAETANSQYPGLPQPQPQAPSPSASPSVVSNPASARARGPPAAVPPAGFKAAVPVDTLAPSASPAPVSTVPGASIDKSAASNLADAPAAAPSPGPDATAGATGQEPPLTTTFQGAVDVTDNGVAPAGSAPSVPAQASAARPPAVSAPSGISNSDVCRQQKDQGPCTTFVARWFHNPSTQQCESFQYGSCGGNLNNFESEDLCKARCLAGAAALGIAVPAECAPEKDPGPCKGYHARWYYNSRNMRCEQFVYGGCDGNSNNFVEKDLCENVCPVESKLGSLTIPPAIGLADAPAQGSAAGPPAPPASGSQRPPAQASSAPPQPGPSGPPRPPGSSRRKPGSSKSSVQSPSSSGGYGGYGDNSRPTPSSYEQPSPRGYGGPSPDNYGGPENPGVGYGGDDSNSYGAPYGGPPSTGPVGFGPAAAGSNGFGPPAIGPPGIGQAPGVNIASYGEAPTGGEYGPAQPSDGGYGQQPSSYDGTPAPNYGQAASPSYGQVPGPSYGSPDSNSYAQQPNAGYGSQPDDVNHIHVLAQQQPKYLSPFQGNVPSCPNGGFAMRHQDGSTMSCLPGKSECPPQGSCNFNGLNFFCCPAGSEDQGGYDSGSPSSYAGPAAPPSTGYGGSPSYGSPPPPADSYGGGQQGNYQAQAPAGYDGTSDKTSAGSYSGDSGAYRKLSRHRRYSSS